MAGAGDAGVQFFLERLFYTICLDAYGYSKAGIGLLWAFGVVCEIGVFLAMSRLLRRFEVRVVLLASFGLAAVRWLLIGFFPRDIVLIVVAQALHAATFGSFHAAGMQTVYRFFTGRHQHRGQAIYSTVSFGLGAAVGSFYSGHSWDTFGPEATCAVAAGCALLALVIGARWLKPIAGGRGRG